MGKRFFLHPVVIMSALMLESRSSRGAGRRSPRTPITSSTAVRGKLGFLLEVPPIMPLIAATVFPGSGERHQALLEQLPYTQSTIALSRTALLPEDEGGTVKLQSPQERRVSIDYPLRAFHSRRSGRPAR